jgi:hypothetical protein
VVVLAVVMLVVVVERVVFNEQMRIPYLRGLTM